MRKFFRKIFKISLIFLLFFFSFSLFLELLSNLYFANLNFIGEKILSGGVEIYDRTEKILLYKIGTQRIWTDFNEIPEKIIKAILITEDKDFYHHKGISWEGILRSIYLNLKNRKLEYGGSTITQQLARTLFLNQEKTFLRKTKEIILALSLEKSLSKNKILTLYLNSIYYGEGNIGIRAAADYYFEKKLKDLTWAESAILAAIPKSPALYSPINKANLKRLKERRNYILAKLKQAGYLNENEYSQALTEEIKITETKYSGMLAPHFVIEVINNLKKMFPNENIEEMNLKVITTIDLNLQNFAETAVKEGALKNKINYDGNNAALMAINPKNGEVLVLVGSKDFNDEMINGQVNVPFRWRQLGSAIKPISYAALFELGYPWETIIFDVPTDFGGYNPKNFDKKFKGPINLRIALAESRNIPAVKVFYLALPEKVISLAKKVGMDYLKDWQNYGLSFALGSAEIRMVDLIKFYGALANDGKLTSQTLILKVIKNKQIIYEYLPKEEQIISSETARIINDILKDNNARRSLFQASYRYTVFPSYEVAIKTGTTQFYQDAWTFAYTPNLVIGVWAGNTNGKRMNSLAASLVAALPIAHQFLTQLIEAEKLVQENFPKPQPRIINKPMLNGIWISEKGIHNILYYINRTDPLGTFPENPSLDPQFFNWEKGVKNWLKDYFEKLNKNEDILVSKKF